MNNRGEVKPLVLLVILIVSFALINEYVKKKTKNMTAEDTKIIANRIGLKAVGMDNANQLPQFIEQGDIKSVTQYLDAGYSPDLVLMQMPLLSFAMSSNQREIFDLLIKRGANVNAKDNNGYTLLQGAEYDAKSGRPEKVYFVEALKRAGAQ